MCVCVWEIVPGLLAVEQTKSALRGRRSSCRVMEPLEAEMDAGSEAAGAFLCPAGAPFRLSSSAFSASLLSAGGMEKRIVALASCQDVCEYLVLIHSMHVTLQYEAKSFVLFVCFV